MLGNKWKFYIIAESLTSRKIFKLIKTHKNDNPISIVTGDVARFLNLYLFT